MAHGSIARHSTVVRALALVLAFAACGGQAGPAPAIAQPPASAPAATGMPAASGAAGPTASGLPLAVPASPIATPPPPEAPRSLPLAPRAGPPAIPVRALQARLERIVARQHLPGVAVTIRWEDGREWTGVAGVADAATGEPVTADTAFALASVSKTYLAAVTLRLVERGKLALDDPITRWLPGLDLDRRITVRMLLDHTSGLADFFLHPRIDAALQGKPARAWTFLETLRYVGKPIARPGTRWYYSNTNYLLLGQIVERVTGSALPEVIRAELLDPLELGATWYQVAERPTAPTARGHRLVGSGAKTTARPVGAANGLMPFRSVLTAAAGAGSLAATSEDAAAWMAALVGGDVLRDETLAAAIDDSRATAALKARVPYGLGIQVVSLEGRVAIGHSGRLLGFRSVVRHLPEEHLTIALLTNQSRVDPAVVARQLLRIVFALQPACPTCPERR